MLDKKQIQAIFLFEFKMDCKATETTGNINNAFGQELLMNIQCIGCSRNFAKDMRIWKNGQLNKSQRKCIISHIDPQKRKEGKITQAFKIQ